MNSFLQKKIKQIVTLLTSKTGRLVVINTVGTYLNISFSLFFVLLLTRTMARVEYGAMTVLLNVSYVLANIMEFGTTATIYSHIPGLYMRKEKRIELLGFIKTTVVYQSVLSVIVIVLLIAAFPSLDKHFFKTGSSMPILIITSLSVLGLVWQNTLLNMFFSIKKFMHANIWLNVSNILKTIFILFLLPFGWVNAGTVIFTFGVVGPGIFIGIAGWLYRNEVRDIFKIAKASREQLKIEYTLTNFIAMQFYNLGMRMDLFIMSYFGLRTQVADYGLSQKVMLTIISTVVSITQVLSPRYALIKTRMEAQKELKHSLLYLLLPTALFASLILLPDWVFTLVFTHKFIETPMLARALGAAYILFSLGQVFSLFYLYTFKKPQMLLISNITFFVIVTGGCFLLIPSFKAMAGPIVLGVAFFVTTAIQGFGYLREVKRLPQT